MNSTHFIKDKYDIKWGCYPYYRGDTYNKNNICYLTFGCSAVKTYGEIDRNSGVTISSDYNKYLAMDISSKNYYGDDIFQRKTLGSDDDYIRKSDVKFAIPTKDELKNLLDNSNIYVAKQNNEFGIIIAPLEGTGSIFIPFMGYVGYNIQNNTLVGNITGITKGYYGIKKEWLENDYSEFVEYSYSNYFLVSDLATNNDVWVAEIRVSLHTINKDLDEDGEKDDLEFIGFDIQQQDGKPYAFREISYSTNKVKNMGMIVLPIYHNDDFNVNFNGGLYNDGSILDNFNQETGNEKPPLLRIEGFGSPKTNGGFFDERFSVKNKTLYDLKTVFKKNENTSYEMSEFETKNFIKEGENKVKIKNGDNYWIIENNPNLYKIDIGGGLSCMIFDTRDLISNNQTTINIDINVNIKEKYETNRFVLPSIYKPFYIKRIYSIDYAEGIYELTFNISVYNGIGLFAKQGTNNMPKMRSIGGNFGFEDMGGSSNDQFQINQSNSNTGLVTPGWVNPNITTGSGSSGSSSDGSTSGSTSGSTGGPIGPALSGSTNTKPNWDYKDSVYYTKEDYALRTTLNSYFDGDARFYENMYDLYDKKEDLYAIGLINDNVAVGSTGLSPVISVYRTKPLILCNYNESIFEVIGWGEAANLEKQENVFLDTSFISVKEPYKNTQFNRNKTTNYGDIKFGNLYDKVKIYYMTAAQNGGGLWIKYYSKDDVVNIISSGNSNGIRYYLVNQAFYDNYISSPESKNGVSYNEEYLKNKEEFDLNPHLVDFTVGDTYNNRFTKEFFNKDATHIEGVSGEWESIDYEEQYYVPFFDMTPSLRNTLGYAYSKVKHGSTGATNFEINYNAPIAMELYIDNNNINFNYSPTNGNAQVIYYYRNLYLIGVYSPLTVLPGSCMEEEGMYYNQIMNNTTLLPQCDETTIIYCYGEVTINEPDPDLY